MNRNSQAKQHRSKIIIDGVITIIALASVPMTWLLTQSVVGTSIVAGYAVCLWEMFRGRKFRKQSMEDPNVLTDDYSRKQLETPMTPRQRIGRFIQGLVAVSFAPPLYLWTRFGGFFSATVPREYYLTVAMARQMLRGLEFGLRWLIYFGWLCFLFALWGLFPDARSVIGLIVYASYATLCISVVGLAIAPHSIAEYFKVSSAKSPIKRYWLAVPVIALTLWLTAFMVSVIRGDRTVSQADLVDSLRSFPRYKKHFSDLPASAILSEPSRLLDLVPAACLFLLVVPGVKNFKDFRRSDLDWLRQAQQAVEGVKPDIALAGLENIHEVTRSDVEVEFRVVALAQSGRLSDAAKELKSHSHSEEFEKLGVEPPTLALSFASKFPNTEESFRKVVRQWLGGGPTPLEVLYIVLEQPQTSLTNIHVVASEVSCPERDLDDETIAAVMWQINANRILRNHGKSLLAFMRDYDVDRSIGWLPENSPLSVQLAGDMAHVLSTSDSDQVVARLEEWVPRAQRWCERFKCITNGFDALLALRLGTVAIEVTPPSIRDQLCDSLLHVSERVERQDVKLPPPFQALKRAHFEKMLSFKLEAMQA